MLPPTVSVLWFIPKKIRTVDHGSLLVERDEVTHQPIFVIVLQELSLLFCNFVITTAYQLGRYQRSSPSTKELSSGF